MVLTGIRTHAANLQARVAEQGHITDRFTKAIEQLGNDKLEVRLGAIYALERIAWDSQRDHWPIMETLTAYVRENAPWPPKEETEVSEKLLTALIPVSGDPSDKLVTEEDPVKPRTDIQAILTVLGRRNRDRADRGQLNLTNTHLRKADLWNANLKGANLRGANLEHTRGLTIEQLDRAFRDETTKLPKDIMIPLADAAEQ